MKNVFLFLFLGIVGQLTAQRRSPVDTSESTVSKNKAIAFLDSIQTLPQSTFWPNINPIAFMENVRQNVLFPLKLSTGRGTNFCAYGTISYTCLKNEPYRYVQCMVALYTKGQARYRKVFLHPSSSIRKAAGKMIFSGVLDRNPADQIWFLSLAHRFKGYLNIFNLKYNPGDENKIWAAVNLAKFNRMLRKMCKYKVWSRGSDLLRIREPDMVNFLQKRIKQGEVYLYLNNGILRKKNHNKIKRMIPTHFVLLSRISYDQTVGQLTIKYWDGDYYTIKEVGLNTFKKIIYGISWTKYKAKQDEVL